MNPPSVALRGVGLYLPPIEVPNAALAGRFESRAPGFVGKMEAQSGIRTRWRARPEQATSDLTVEAARAALAAAQLSPRDLDLIVLGTDSPDFVTPATSVVVQHKLGATEAGTFDVGCACASFPTGLAAAKGLMSTNPALRNVLVAGAYLMSRLADPDDPMSFFYGDGAGAVVLSFAREPGVLGAAFRADGAYARRWGIMSGGTAEPASVESVQAGRTQVRLLERYPPEVNEEGWPLLVRRLAHENAFTLEAVDHFFFTQVRKSTIEAVMRTLGQPIERAHLIMHKWGYTGSACLPMALADALAAGKLQPGQLAVLVGSGVGYNQAAVAVRLTDELFGLRSSSPRAASSETP